jgi:hypothetical protein
MSDTKAIGPNFANELQAAGLLGLPFAWEPGGTITFGSAITSAQVTAVEAVYAAHNPATPDLIAEATAALSVPVAVTFTSTTAMDGSYAIDPVSQGKMAAVSAYILTNGKFPGGAATYPWVDVTGVARTFPTTSLFQTFATAIADHVSVLDLIIATSSGTLPAASIAITG